MELAQFCSTSRVIIVAGKGGVGKTTVTATLAVAAARTGMSVLIVEVEGKSGLAAAFDRPRLGYEESDLAPRIRARTLTPDAALVDWLEGNGLKRISKRLVQTGALDVVATAVPGMKDIFVLGKVKSLDVRGTADLIIVDAPAAGHAITFLTSAQGLLDAVSVGPVRKQATDVVELLSDPERCQVLLVTIPEETPVSELVDTAFAIEDRTGVSLGPVVVNGCYEETGVGAPGADDADARRRQHHRGRDPARRRAARRVRLRSRGTRPGTRRRVPGRAVRDPAPPGRPARAAAAAPADPAPVPLHRGPRSARDRAPRRRVHRRSRHPVTRTLAEVVEQGHVVVCCGSGGVGKTTSAAVLAMEGARRGRRALVVTIDPAKRLANALGLDELSNEPREIATDRWDPKGERADGGALSAMMLDTKSTFDGLVTRYASSPEQTERILENSFYRNISSALSGTQEYMAMEKLHELDEEGGFDLIVVDTPPSRHALDFLDAPQRLLRLLDNRIFRLLMVPTRTGMRIAGAAVQAFLRTISRVVGSEVVNDIVAFFRAFEGMEEGFRERAKKVVELLGEPTTRFVLITSPRRDAVEEARFFAEKIGDHSLSVDALIVNRVHPRFGTEHSSGLRARAASLRELRPGGKEGAAARDRLAARYDNLADFNEIAERERSHLETVRVRVGSAAVAFVPYLAHDVYDFDALSAVGQILFSGTVDPEAPEPPVPGADE